MTIAALWIPIVCSALVVFVASFLVWMVLPHHKADVKPLPDEQALTDHLNTLSIPPGTYMWPNCSDAAEMKSEAFKERFNRGPWGSMTVVGSKPNFARNLVAVLLFYIVVSIFVGYITAQARSAGADFAPVFQVAGATAVLAYCAGSIPGAVFFGKPSRFILTEFVDGVVYGLLTGVVFALLWPGAAA